MTVVMSAHARLVVLVIHKDNASVAQWSLARIRHVEQMHSAVSDRMEKHSAIAHAIILTATLI